MAEIGPLQLQPRFVEAIWGGRRLAAELGKLLPPDAQIGESWEIFGANPIGNGPFQGLSLDEASRRAAAEILGSRVLARQDPAEGFPLLVKFIDASHALSVQVHPDDSFARENEAGSRGKTEAWYILQAPSDATLVYGLREGLETSHIAASIARGALEHDLIYLPVRPGDAVFVPAGTVHAIGAGILLYEVQQRSEITYRLYDWGRVGSDGRPRELHVDKALAVLRFPQPPARPTPPLDLARDSGRVTYLAACRYFALVALEGVLDDVCDGSTFAALSVVAGRARLHWSGGNQDLPLGSSIVLPSSLGGYRLDVSPGGRVLRATVPDLQKDIVAPLTAAGYSLSEIARLGNLTSE